MAKRIISLVLAIVMLVGLVPLIPTHVEATASKVKTNTELVERLIDVAENYKTLYVMGAYGGALTKAMKDFYYNHDKYNRNPERWAMITAASSDTFAFDCVCMIKGVLWGWDGTSSTPHGGAIHGTNGVPDKNADQWINLCYEVSTDFSEIEIGEVLWTDGHVGIYIGNSKAVECTPGWKNGVQITDVQNHVQSGVGHKWKKHGKMPYIEYVDPIIDDNFPAYCAIKIKQNINVNSQPCEPTTDASSKTLETAKKDAQYQAIGLYLNKWGNLWYKVRLKESSGTGYLYAGNTTYLANSINDIEPSGVTGPPTLTKGKAWSLTGTVKSAYNELTEVSVYVHKGSTEQGAKVTGGTDKVSNNAYHLKDSPVDSKTKFDTELDVGTYTYIVSATYKYCYATSGKTYETKTDTIPIFQSTFSVVASTSCSHSYTSKVTTAATCGAKGVTTKTCSKCGDVRTESIPATGNHTYTDKVTKEETCTTSGIRTYTCSGCSHSYTETIEAYGHYYTPWETVNDPTCIKEGLQERTCFTCLHVDTQAIPTTEHKYQASVIDATCVDYKKTIYTCYICQDSYVEYDSATFTDWSTTYPTGIDESLIESRTEYRYQTKEYTTSDKSSLDGWTQYAVSTQWTDYGSWSDWSDTAVTANDSTKVESRKVYKWYYYQCPNCGAHMHGWGITCPTYAGGCGKGNITSDHYVKVWLTTSPDNANVKDFHGTGKYYAEIDGQRVFKHSDPESKTQYRYCTREQQTIYSYYKWSDWSAWGTSAVTATDDVQVETRTVYRYLDVKLADHKYTSTVTAPTCAAQGYTTHTCSVCGDFYIDSYVSQLEHSYQSTVTKPTCTTNGYTHNICSACGDSFYSNYQPAPGHAYTDVVTKPTCQTQGYTTHTCSVCGDNYVDSYTDYAECNYVYQSTVAPTADRTGLINEQCSYCGGYNQIVIPALNGEDYTVEVVQTPSCTENGIQRYTWKDTSHGVYYFDVLIESTGHTYTAKTVVEPTCTTQGYTTRICDVCSAGYTADYVSALGHDYQNGICTRCGAADPDYTIDPSIVDSGVCGDDLRWTLYVNGELEISGTGNMYKYSSSTGSEAPWYKYAKDIMTVSFAGEPTSIGTYAFKDCVNLGNFEIPESVTLIGGQAFRNCDSLTEVIIPDSVTGVGGYMFTMCDNLEIVEIGDGIAKFDSSYPFGGCDSLISIKIGSGVTALSPSTFWFCNGLTNVEIDTENATYCSIDGVIYTKDQTTLVAVPTAKKGKVVVSENTKKIGTEAFQTCKLITEVELPEGLTSIGRCAFQNCYGITRIEFPSSLTSISDTAFRACTGLKEIYFKGSAPVFWDTNIFANVTATAYYPANDSTWTDSKQQSCGGNLTWVPVSGCINSHNLKEVAAVQPTTEKDGNIAHYICDDCDKLFADSEGKTELAPEDVILEKIPGTAQINSNYYHTLADALIAAKSGDTVKLLCDSSEAEVIIRTGVTLDLNGHVLSSEYVFTVKNSRLIDSSAENTGMLKVNPDCASISPANAQLPVWNGEGYVFTKVTYRKALVAHNADMVKFAFLPQFQSVATELLKDGFEGNKVTVEVRVSWETIQGREYRNLVFNNDQVGLGISSGGAFILTFSGFSQLNLTTDVAIEAVVYSETGVSVASEAIVVDVTGE